MYILIRILIGVIILLITELAYLAATGRIKIGILLDAREDEKDKINHNNLP